MATAAVIAAIDSGTTNARVRLLRDEQIIGGASAQVGVVNTAKTGSNAALKRGIRGAFVAALWRAHLTLVDVPYALGAGMVTSELGALELPWKANALWDVNVMRQEKIYCWGRLGAPKNPDGVRGLPEGAVVSSLGSRCGTREE
jgi:hypothetical protein